MINQLKKKKKNGIEIHKGVTNSGVQFNLKIRGNSTIILGRYYIIVATAPVQMAQ